MRQSYAAAKREAGVVPEERKERLAARGVSVDELGEEWMAQQQVTRIPAWRPGMWVKLKGVDQFPDRFSTDLAGRVVRVKSLTACLKENQPKVIWRLHTPDGRCVTVDKVERLATEAEVSRMERFARYDGSG